MINRKLNNDQPASIFSIKMQLQISHQNFFIDFLKNDHFLNLSSMKNSVNYMIDLDGTI